MLAEQEKTEQTQAPEKTPEKTEEKTPENPEEKTPPPFAQELADLAADMAMSERAMLSWQIKGSFPAIMFAANYLRDDYRHFSPGHARIQDAIFDLHQRNERITLNVLDRTLAQSPRPDNERAYLVALGRVAPAVKNDFDLAHKLSDCHKAWRTMRARKEVLLAPPVPLAENPENPEPANTNESGDIAVRAASPVPSESDFNQPTVIDIQCTTPKNSQRGYANRLTGRTVIRKLTKEQHAQMEAREQALERVRNAPMSSAAARFEWTEPKHLVPRDVLLSGHAVRGFVSGTVAPGGVGKTALVLAEALNLVTGSDIFQTGLVQSPEPHKVWYIGLEDPLDEYRRRVAAAALLHKFDGLAIRNGFFLNVAAGNNFVMTERASGGAEICRPVVDSIIASIRERLISFVIVDPFVASHRASESDNMTIAMVVRAWAHIAEKTGAAIELVHHTRKRTGDEPAADDVRGASALVNAMRAVRLLVPMSEEEASTYEVYDPSRYFRVVSAKNNLSARAREPEWREFVPVNLGNALGAYLPGDVVGAVRLWKPPALASEEQMEEIRERLSGGQYRLDVRAEDWAGKAIAEVLGLNVRDSGARTIVRRAIKRWVEEGVLRVEHRMDEIRHVREFIGVGKLPQPASEKTSAGQEIDRGADIANEVRS